VITINADSLALFDKVMELLPEKPQKYMEQGVFNIALHNDPNIKLCLLDETWNHMIPAGEQPIQEYYINHFGGDARALLKSLATKYEHAAKSGPQA